MPKFYKVVGGYERTFEMNVEAETRGEAEDIAQYRIEEMLQSLEDDDPRVYIDGAEELDYEEV